MIVQMNSESHGERSDSPADSPPSSAQGTAAELGRSVRAARRSLSLDQREVALIANVSPRTVHAVEHGKPTMRLDVLLRILEAVGLRLSIDARAKVWAPGAKRQS